jgi:methionyl-tRNA formyltransferase
MKVAILCENLNTGLRILAAVKQVPHIESSIWVNRNPKYSKLYFIASQIFALIAAARKKQLSLFLQSKCKISSKILHHPKTINKLKIANMDIGLHAAGVIYKNPVIQTFRLGILNPHIGLLPHYRGRSVMEWSILEGLPTGITTFFIDEGIDTGEQIVLREEISIAAFHDIVKAKQYLFSKDSEMFVRALKKLQDPEFMPFLQKPEEGKRYYVMSNLFKNCVTKILADHAT